MTLNILKSKTKKNSNIVNNIQKYLYHPHIYIFFLSNSPINQGKALTSAGCKQTSEATQTCKRSKQHPFFAALFFYLLFLPSSSSS